MMTRLAKALAIFAQSALIALCLIGMAQAQDNAAPDYAAWDQVALEAQALIDNPQTAMPELEALRAELVLWRTQFQDAQSVNAARIATVQSQIKALGPPPADGATEAADLADARAALDAELSDLMAPVRRAEAAFSATQGMIRQIDARITEQQADALLQLQPAPVNPANWPSAIATAGGVVLGLGREIFDFSLAPEQLSNAKAQLPLVLALLVGAGLLAARGGRVIARLTTPLLAQEEASPRARLGLFGLSLLHHLIPVAVVFAIAQALQVSGLVGARGAILVNLAAPFALTLMGAVWLGRQAFPIRDNAPALIRLPPEARAKGRGTARALGLVVAIWVVVDAVSAYENFSAADRLVLTFPVVVLSGILLVRLSGLLRLHVSALGQGDAPSALSLRFMRALVMTMRALGLLGPLLAGVGYFTAGSSFLLPMIFSLALMAIVGILQRVVTDAYGAITARNEGLDEALAPTLIGFFLILAALPALALIWGMRPAQLADIWAAVVAGFSVGGVTISPRNFLIFAVVFALGYTATRALQSTLRSNLLPKTRIDAGGQSAIVTGTGYTGIFLAAVFAITSAGIDLSSLAIVAGALSVGIGFGLQTIVSNFVSGIILLIERPFKEGDWIEVGGQMGYVREISVRSTRIETFDRSDLIVPNADLIAGMVTNKTHSSNSGRLVLRFGVGYGSDPDRVIAILRDVAEAHPMVVMNPKPAILFMNFGADALEFEIRAILRDVNFSVSVTSDVNLEVLRRFRAEGIEMPFAQRDLWLRNPEALVEAMARKGNMS